MFEDGQIIGGHYKILGQLGVGGMGTVFHALDTHLSREVALKFVHEDLLEIEEYRLRFMHEGRILASLRHKNIVEVYTLEIEEETKTPFMVMEYAPGKPLSDPMSKKEKKAKLLSYLLQTVQGIEACHQEGVIHRDIKPDNILIDENGRVKIVDFGLAKTDVKLTMTGAVLGTATYMSPEQCAGTPQLTPKSDVYSLGIILWELLLGQPPFQPDEDSSNPFMAVSLMHMSAPPPLALLRKDTFGNQFAGILERMLSKEPEVRPEPMEIVSFLEQAISKAQEPSDPQDNAQPNLELRVLLGSLNRPRR